MLFMCNLNSHFASILIVWFAIEVPNCGKESESHGWWKRWNFMVSRGWRRRDEETRRPRVRCRDGV